MFGQKPNIIDEKVFYCCSDPLRDRKAKNSKTQGLHSHTTANLDQLDLPKFNQFK